MSDDLWADFDAAPLNLWIGQPTTGHWCETCQLPSALRFPLSFDPAASTGSWIDRCPECHPFAQEAS